jgi:multidrug efflux pump
MGDFMKRFNLSAWALEHPQFTLFLMLFLVLAGINSYFHLGRSEEPAFTIKVMIVRTLWPGATAQEMEQQVTERVEKKLQTVPWLDHLRSYSKPGESTVFVILKDATPPAQVPYLFQQIRKKLDDVKSNMPAGVYGPFPNDEFGDVYVNIFALTGDGVSVGELRREADRIARELRRISDVKKVDLFGVQSEKIFVDIPPARLAQLGLTPAAIIDALQQQNAMVPGGFVETRDDRLQVRVSGAYDSVEKVRNTPLSVANRRLRLGDIATVSRGFSDPPDTMMRVAGQDAIGIGVVMEQRGDVIALGEHVRQTVARIKAATPRGIDFHVIADQPAIVSESVEQFMRSFAEAVAIVLLISFVSLGLRTGLVVALSIPIVLAATFLAMRIFGIDLQKISLGAMIIALGLLVDDAIIAVEMMVVKIEQGWDKAKAATFAYTSTAMPMLIGTLITAAGFMPVGLAVSASSEYTFTLFAVVVIALLLSWIVAVLFTPFIGFKILSVKKLHIPGADHAGDIYNTPFYRRFRKIVEWCLHHRWRVIVATAGALIGAVVLFRTVIENQFFPSSEHREVLVYLWLPEGASIQATKEAGKRLEAKLATDPGLQSYVGYVGAGSPRFQLGQNQQLENNNFAEYVVLAKDVKSRDELRARIEAVFNDPNGGFAGARARTQIFRHGPPVDYAVEFRLSGEDIPTLRRYAEAMATEMRKNKYARNVHLDWSTLGKGVRVVFDEDKARELGVSRQSLSTTLQAVLNGIAITQMREDDQLVDVTWRGNAESRRVSELPNILIPTASGHAVPLAQLARLEPIVEEGVIWRWDRQRSILVQADVTANIQGPTVTAQMLPALQPIIDKLPPGYHFDIAGMAESSAKGEGPIGAVVPWVILVVAALLMIQLQSFSLSAMVMLTAPLGIIGVALALALAGKPFGFVALLGTIALLGMIMRNSVILVDQIAQDMKLGKHLWDAIIDSTVRRFRPIVLTAAASMLGMIPLLSDTLWGTMAVAIMGGLVVATVLTCLFLPALYAAWYRVRKPG